MGTKKIIKYPILGLNSALTTIMYQVVDFVKQPFTNDFFKYIHVDTKNGFKDMYKSTEPGSKMKRLQKSEYPKLVALFDLPDGLKSNDTGIGKMPMNRFNSEYTDSSMNNYNNFYIDNYGISMYSSDIRIRVNVGLRFEVKTREDQLSLAAMLLDSHKFQGYGTRLINLVTRFQIPNQMMHFLSTVLINNSKEEADIKIFDDHLENYSMLATEARYEKEDIKVGGIKHVFFNGDKEKDYYQLERLYRKIYFQFTGEPELSDGDMTGKVFKQHTISATGFFELYVPISLIMQVPKMINTHKVSDILTMSNKPMRDTELQVREIQSTENNTVMSRYEPDSKYITIHDERNIQFELKTEKFNLLQYLNDTKEKSIELQVLLLSMKNKKYSELFLENELRFTMYEGQYILDEGDLLKIDDDYNVTVIENIVQFDYTILIKCDKTYMLKLIKDYEAYGGK